MLPALTALLLCQLAGESLARGFNLPVPGPAIGLLLLSFALIVRSRLFGHGEHDIEASSLGRVSSALLSNLGVLFVPAGVGLIQNLDLLVQHGAAIAAAIIGSSIAALLVTVGTFRLVRRILEARG